MAQYNDIYPQDNAASLYTEVNSIGNWVGVGDFIDVTSINTDSYHGSNSLQMELLSNDGNKRSELLVPVVSGTNYRAIIKAKSVVGTNSRFRLWLGFTTQPDVLIDSTDWKEYTFDLVANVTGDATLRVYVNHLTNNLGDTVLIDSFELINLDATPPASTTVRVTWKDSVSAGVIGHKVYRDDVEIADVGMGVEVWYDDTAEKGATYKYEVQAYSASDETTTETIGVNVKSITTAS